MNLRPMPYMVSTPYPNNLLPPTLATSYPLPYHPATPYPRRSLPSTLPTAHRRAPISAGRSKLIPK